jgi:hypothetical protein
MADKWHTCSLEPYVCEHVIAAKFDIKIPLHPVTFGTYVLCTNRRLQSKNQDSTWTWRSKQQFFIKLPSEVRCLEQIAK